MSSILKNGKNLSSMNPVEYGLFWKLSSTFWLRKSRVSQMCLSCRVSKIRTCRVSQTVLAYRVSQIVKKIIEYLKYLKDVEYLKKI